MEFKLSKEELDYIAERVAKIMVSQKSANCNVTLNEALWKHRASGWLCNAMMDTSFRIKGFMDMPVSMVSEISSDEYLKISGMGDVRLKEFEKIIGFYGCTLGSLSVKEFKKKYKR